MKTPTAPRRSDGIQALDALFDGLKKPYGQGEVVRFNLAYQRLYPQLSRAEKLDAEKLVDALLLDLEDQSPARKSGGLA
jgi:hypothetical protein